MFLPEYGKSELDDPLHVHCWVFNAMSRLLAR